MRSIKELVDEQIVQALKELKEEVIGEVPSKMNTDNWKYDRRVAELKLWQHQAIDNKIKALEEGMIGYKDRTYCGSDVEVHTCGREFTEQDAKDAEKWWGGKDYPVAYMKFCEEELKDEQEQL